MYVYKVASPPDGYDFASIGNGGPTMVIKTLEEVPGLTPLTAEEAKAEVVAMGFDETALDECGLGGEG